jgi:hypothetical protein
MTQVSPIVIRGEGPEELGTLCPEVRSCATKNEGTITIMFSHWFKRSQTLEAIREHATDGVTTWLTGFAPGLVPERPDPATDDPSAAGWMHRFARDVITTNPVSRAPLSGVQIYLLEQALGCVDWPALARDRRLRHLDWSRASLTHPRTDCGVARLPGLAPRPVQAD